MSSDSSPSFQTILDSIETQNLSHTWDPEAST